MKVSELMEILKSQNPEDEIKIIDADTDWQLPIFYAGKDFEHINKNSQGGVFKEDLKENVVYIVSNYWNKN